MSTATAVPVSALPPVPARSHPPRGRVGILTLILTETALFLIFVGAYAFYIGKSITGPFPHDVLAPPIVNTICLLSSSFTIVLATRALRAGKVQTFGLWWLVTLLLAIEFLVGTGAEWYGLIYHHGLTIRTNLFGTTYYSLVGLHATHVTVGALLIAFVLILSMLGHVNQRDAERTEVLSWYWHFVDAVWVVVFLTVYVIGR